MSEHLTDPSHVHFREDEQATELQFVLKSLKEKAASNKLKMIILY